MEDAFEYEISITMSGNSFSPRILKTLVALPLTNCFEIGDVIPLKGIHKLRSSGSATLRVKETSLMDGVSPFDELLNSINANLGLLHQNGVTDISIWVAIFQAPQGNWNATKEQIQKIAQMDGSLAITYYR